MKRPWGRRGSGPVFIGQMSRTQLRLVNKCQYPLVNIQKTIENGQL